MWKGTPALSGRSYECALLLAQYFQYENTWERFTIKRIFLLLNGHRLRGYFRPRIDLMFGLLFDIKVNILFTFIILIMRGNFTIIALEETRKNCLLRIHFIKYEYGAYVAQYSLIQQETGTFHRNIVLVVTFCWNKLEICGETLNSSHLCNILINFKNIYSEICDI